MIKLAVIIMLFLAISNFVMCSRKINIVRLAVFSLVGTVSVYILISGILFWFDIFSIQKAVLGSIVLQGQIFIILCKFGIKGSIEFDFKRYSVPIIIIFVAVPLVWNKYGFYGMGQDEGVYQNHAIQLMYGKNDVQLDFEEYGTLSTDEERNYYKQELHTSLTGYYFYDPSLETTDESHQISPVSGTIHGIPTFAALLALWGRLFGLTHMVDIQTVFFICAIFMLYFISEELKVRKSVGACVTGLFAISPIILWVSKSSLTEIFLTVLIECFLYGIINFKEKEKSWWAVLSAVTFAFYHFTVYTMLPMFVLIYWGIYLYEKDNRYIVQTISLIFGCMVGLTMSCFVAPAYTIGGIIDGHRTGNFKPLYNMLPWINESNVLTVVSVACLGMILLSVGLIFMKRYIKIDFGEHKKMAGWIVRMLFAGLIVYNFYMFYKIKIFEDSWLRAFYQSTFFGYGMVIGFFILISICVLWIIRTDILVKNMKNLLVAFAFIYCIMIYAAFLRPNTQYYYYYARYMAPYVPVVLVVAAVLLNEIRLRYVYFQTIMSVVVLLPYLPFFYSEMDDTQLNRDTLFEISDVIEDQSIIIMNSTTGRFLYLPVRTMTGASVYFLEDDFLKQLEKPIYKNKRIYYLTVEDESIVDKYDIKHDTVLKVKDATGENCEYRNNLWFPFPVKISDEYTTVSCYQIR